MLVLGSKIFLLHCFFNPFLQLAAGKKDSKNGAARTFFGPSYFDLTLVCSTYVPCFQKVVLCQFV